MEEDREKTVFACHKGIFEFTVGPFGGFCVWILRVAICKCLVVAVSNVRSTVEKLVQ